MEWSRRTPVDEHLTIVIIALTLVGILAVFSASWPVASQPADDGTPGNPYKFLVSQTVFATVGGLMCLALAFLAPQRLRAMAPWLYVVSLVLLALCFSRLGVTMGGAKSWVRLGPVQFQPSEIAKLALILMLSRCVASAKRWPEQRTETFIASMGLTLPVCALCIAQPDLGTAVLAFSFGLIALFLAGVRFHLLALSTATAGALALLFARMEPYRWARITTFLNPTEDTTGTGYQVARMLITIARGGVFGQGLGLSKEKWIALPARHTDSIFCVIAGELGLIGAAALVIAFFLLARRALVLARTQPDLFSAVLMATLGTSIALQAFINMGVAAGLLPCTGLTLPFISAGGTSLVCTLAAAGMLLSLSRQSAREKGGQLQWRPASSS